MRRIEAAWSIVHRYGRKYGPYVILEAVMPGGTLLALALYAYRSRLSFRP